MVFACPHCDRDIAERLGELPRLPTPGSYLLCYGCTQLSAFNNEMKLEKRNDDELPPDILEQVKVFRHLLKTAKFVCCEPSSLN